MGDENLNTKTFTLAFGLKRDEVVHKKLVLRKPTIADWINLAKDAEVAELGVRYGHLPLGNTLGNVIAQGPQYQLFSILIAMLAVSLGDLTNLSRKDFQQLAPIEMDMLMLVTRGWLNFEESASEESAPLGSEGSSIDSSGSTESEPASSS